MDSGTYLFYVVAWFGLWGTICALIGPRKGFEPIGGFGIGAIFGPLGVLFLALKRDVSR